MAAGNHAEINRVLDNELSFWLFLNNAEFEVDVKLSLCDFYRWKIFIVSWEFVFCTLQQPQRVWWNHSKTRWSDLKLKGSHLWLELIYCSLWRLALFCFCIDTATNIKYHIHLEIWCPYRNIVHMQHQGSKPVACCCLDIVLETR